MEVKNERLNDDEFLQERERVLAMWPTGKEVDLDEAVEYHKSMPPHKSYVRRHLEAKQTGMPLVHSLMGYTTFEQQKDLLLHLQNEGQSDLLICIPDSLTRTGQFEATERQLKEAEETGKNLLNGYPIVAHGVHQTRKLFEAIDRPCSAGGPAIDQRLVGEIALASGFTNGGWVTIFIAFETYTKTASLEEAIHNHQYGCRLAAYYEERGALILCVAPSGAGGDNAPVMALPSLGPAGAVLGALITATQGPKYISNMYICNGNLCQDIASSITRMKLMKEYLDRFDCKGVELFMVNSQGGSYPLDHASAFALSLYPAIVTVLAGSHVCQTKTFDEADSIPTKENNAMSLRAARMMVNILKDQKIDMLSNETVKSEAAEEEREARVIVERVLELGEGDVCVGAVKAYEQGVLDNPLANNPRVMAKVSGVRDAQGAVRYLNPGNLPLSKDMLEFHREKLAERKKILGKEVDYDTVVDDMLSLSRGSLVPPVGK